MPILHNVLEAPVVSHDFKSVKPHSDAKTWDEEDWTTASSFMPPDDRKVKSEKWRSGFVGKWKDPRKYKLFFLEMSMEEYLDLFMTSDKAAELRSRAAKHKLSTSGASLQNGIRVSGDAGDTKDWPVPEPDPTAITMIYTGNESDPYESAPLSTWMLAHRMAHAIAGIPSSQYDNYVNTLNDVILRVARGLPLVSQLGGRISCANTAEIEHGQVVCLAGRASYYPEYDFAKKFCKFKSKKNLGDFEIYNEILAQKVVNGHVTFLRSERPDIDKVLHDGGKRITAALDELLDSLVGKVIAF